MPRSKRKTTMLAGAVGVGAAGAIATLLIVALHLDPELWGPISVLLGGLGAAYVYFRDHGGLFGVLREFFFGRRR